MQNLLLSLEQVEITHVLIKGNLVVVTLLTLATDVYNPYQDEHGAWFQVLDFNPGGRLILTSPHPASLLPPGNFKLPDPIEGTFEDVSNPRT